MKSEIKTATTTFITLTGDIEFRNVSYTYPNTGIQAFKECKF